MPEQNRPPQQQEQPQEKQLSDADQARVDKVLRTGVNATERAPFRPWRLLSFVWLVLLAMGGISYLIGSQVGVV